MGAAIQRNRYWWYRSLYDDYVGREMRMAFSIGSVIWVPHYVYGCFLNRKIEESYAIRIYSHEWGPRRNRLTHSLVFEQFEQVLENWQQIDQELGSPAGKAIQQKSK